MQSIDPRLIVVVAFAAGFFVSLLLIAVAKLLKKRDVSKDIEFLQFERDHREQMARSKAILHKNTQRSIFFCLFLLGIAVLASYFIRAVYSLPELPDLFPEDIVIGEAASQEAVRVDPYTTESSANNSVIPEKAGIQENPVFPAKAGIHHRLHYLPLVLWLIYTFFSFLRYRRFSDVNSYMKAINKIDDKLVKLQKKLAGK